MYSLNLSHLYKFKSPNISNKRVFSRCACFLREINKHTLHLVYYFQFLFVVAHAKYKVECTYKPCKHVWFKVFVQTAKDKLKMGPFTKMLSPCPIFVTFYKHQTHLGEPFWFNLELESNRTCTWVQPHEGEPKFCHVFSQSLTLLSIVIML